MSHAKDLKSSVSKLRRLVCKTVANHKATEVLIFNRYEGNVIVCTCCSETREIYILGYRYRIKRLSPCRVVEIADFITTLNYSIISLSCLVWVRAPHGARETSQGPFAVVPGDLCSELNVHVFARPTDCPAS